MRPTTRSDFAAANIVVVAAVVAKRIVDAISFEIAAVVTVVAEGEVKALCLKAVKLAVDIFALNRNRPNSEILSQFVAFVVAAAVVVGVGSELGRLERPFRLLQGDS